jgi:uroporphyrinogen-III synthase
MGTALDGLTVLVPESRELDLFAELLEAEGAAAIRCPLVQICDLENPKKCTVWIDQLIAGSFQDVIWLTGEGLRRLLAIAEGCSCGVPFVTALGLVRNVTRGPKPARALREIGLTPNLAASAPTSQGVRHTVAGEDIAGRAIGVQLYPGEGGLPLIAHLRARVSRYALSLCAGRGQSGHRRDPHAARRPHRHDRFHQFAASGAARDRRTPSWA